ncbi:MAG: hemerythrin domain-containing protein [Syntrophales bacterium]
MDIYGILRKEHQEVISLIEKQVLDIKAGRSDAGLVERIQKVYFIHMGAEEKFFYPLLEDREDMYVRVITSYEEHHTAKEILKNIRNMMTDDGRRLARLRFAKELIENHIEAEEKIFRMAEKILNKDAAQEISRRFLEERELLLDTS